MVRKRRGDGTSDDGRGLNKAIVVEVVVLIAVLIGAGAFLLMNTPQPISQTEVPSSADDNEQVINDVTANESDTSSNDNGSSADLDSSGSSLMFPIDKISLPWDDQAATGDVAVSKAGVVEVCQATDEGLIEILAVEDVKPGDELYLEASTSVLVENALYEIRMREPIELSDGRRLSFHAYVVDYRWERYDYLRTMTPSEHDLYELANGEDPDYFQAEEHTTMEQALRNANVYAPSSSTNAANDDVGGVNAHNVDNVNSTGRQVNDVS